MSKRCARCGDLNPRRSVNPSGEWADYLRSNREVNAVGTIVIPLCRDCYSDADELPDDEVSPLVAEFLTELDTGALIDEGR